MNKQQMIEIDSYMNKQNAGQFASMVTNTHVGILKPCGKMVTTKRDLRDGERLVTKRSEFVTQIKTSYLRRAKAVNKDFKLSPRAWGERISPNLVEHKSNLYLETLHSAESNLKPASVTYFVDGKAIDAKELPLKERKPSESGIEVRVFKADSIEQIKISGKTFKKS